MEMEDEHVCLPVNRKGALSYKILVKSEMQKLLSRLNAPGSRVFPSPGHRPKLNYLLSVKCLSDTGIDRVIVHGSDSHLNTELH